MDKPLVTALLLVQQAAVFDFHTPCSTSNKNWGPLGDKGLATHYLNNGQKGFLWLNGTKMALARRLQKMKGDLEVAVGQESETPSHT